MTELPGLANPSSPPEPPTDVESHPGGPLPFTCERHDARQLDRAEMGIRLRDWTDDGPHDVPAAA